LVVYSPSSFSLPEQEARGQGAISKGELLPNPLRLLLCGAGVTVSQAHAGGGNIQVGFNPRKKIPLLPLSLLPCLFLKPLPRKLKCY